MSPDFPATEQLGELLRQRETIIADHAWRDRDPAAHLAALKEVSLAIENWRIKQTTLDPRLAHFLENASFAKALAFLDNSPRPRCAPKP